MAINPRFLESLIHDIPMYPGSTTPDGRIVAELNRGRKSDKEFHEKTLTIQERALDKLVELHKGSAMVPVSDFRADESRRVFEDLAFEMQHVYAEQERSARGIEALGQMTSEGFGQIHGDLIGIKGPNAPAQSLSQLISSDADFFSAMTAYAKGILSSQAESDFRDNFAEKMKFWPNQGWEIEKTLQEQFQREGYKMTADLREALELMKQPERILVYGREEVAKRLAMLSHVANKYQISLLSFFVAEVHSFFDQYRRAQRTPVPEEMLIKLGKSRLLKPTVQNQVIKHYPEVRDDASLTTINYSLLDIARDTRTSIQQRNILGAMGAASLKQQHGMLRQGETAIGQRKTLIEQGNVAQTQREIQIRQSAATNGYARRTGQWHGTHGTFFHR